MNKITFEGYKGAIKTQYEVKKSEERQLNYEICV